MSILIKQDPQAASFTNSQWFTRLCQEYNQSNGGWEGGEGEGQVSDLNAGLFHCLSFPRNLKLTSALPAVS